MNEREYKYAYNELRIEQMKLENEKLRFEIDLLVMRLKDWVWITNNR